MERFTTLVASRNRKPASAPRQPPCPASRKSSRVSPPRSPFLGLGGRLGFDTDAPPLIRTTASFVAIPSHGICRKIPTSHSPSDRRGFVSFRLPSAGTCFEIADFNDRAARGFVSLDHFVDSPFGVRRPDSVLSPPVTWSYVPMGIRTGPPVKSATSLLDDLGFRLKWLRLVIGFRAFHTRLWVDLKMTFHGHPPQRSTLSRPSSLSTPTFLGRAEVSKLMTLMTCLVLRISANPSAFNLSKICGRTAALSPRDIERTGSIL